MKRIIAITLAAVMLISAAACSVNQTVLPTDETVLQFPADQYDYKYQWYATLTPEEIVSALTLEQKAAQMVQPILYKVESDNETPMKTYCYGSIYGDEGMNTAEEWREKLDGYQREAIESEAGIPYIVAQDDVHGVGYCIDAVYFPHNIGQGAANDEELCYQAGLITADETKMCHMLWNLYPCVAQSNDPRWGRNYECYSSDLDTITRLSTAYTKGLIDGGVVATAKHYFGDGNVLYGTGERSDFDRIIDRGDARLSDDEIAELLKVYQAQIDAGVQVIMVSYSSLGGTKMHENKEYIQKLRTEMGFDGLIMSDSMAIQNTSPETFGEQVISAINCGIDLLMEGIRYDDARQSVIDAVKDGSITEDRVNDAVTRIIKLKKDAGVFDDPFCENIKTVQREPGSPEYRAVAEKLVEESLVLIKNDNGTLPIKEGAKVYITGPAADNPRAQCGGWTMGWNRSQKKDISGVTTIKEAFERYADGYGIEVITDPEQAEKADVVLLCVGEDAYAEWHGDLNYLKLCDEFDSFGNRKAIKEARALGKPTVVCVVAGRQLILNRNDFKNWDSVVMCYLPGSEGKGVSDVLCGCSDFTGRLPEPWYGAEKHIRTDECFLERGYGLSYGDGFTPRQEPAALPDTPAPEEPKEQNDPMSGTSYTKGVLSKDGVYTNEYAGIRLSVPEGWNGSGEVFRSPDDGPDNYPTEKDWLRESSTVDDYYFSSSSGYQGFILIRFLNTRLGVPDAPDYTEEQYLEDYKAYTAESVKMFGIKTEYGDIVKVTLGGSEYTEVSCAMSGSGTDQNIRCYARKLDDDLICVIEVGDVGNFESLFG